MADYCLEPNSTPLESFKPSFKDQDPKQVKKAAQDFEKYFVNKLLEEMKKSAYLDDEKKEDNKTEIYDSLLNEQFSNEIAKNGSFGLAKQMEANMQKIIEQYKKSKGDLTP